MVVRRYQSDKSKTQTNLLYNLWKKISRHIFLPPSMSWYDLWSYVFANKFSDDLKLCDVLQNTVQNILQIIVQSVSCDL